jgi:hypothetical protein
MPRDIANRVRTDSAQPKAMAEVCKRAQQYAREPTQAAWDDLVDALRRAYGDDEAFERLHAAQTRTRSADGS